MEAITKLTKDLKNAAITLTKDEARYLVDLYYQIQDCRIRAAGQIRAIEKGTDSAATHETLDFFLNQFEGLESQIQRALGTYAASQRPGRWLKSICGIGPVISAGILANIDITKAQHPQQLWKFAGIANPSVEVWEKGKKRPWNAAFKTLLVFKAGESFVKVQNNDKDFYGKLFAERKALYTKKNESGAFREKCEGILAKKKWKKDTDAYKAYSEGIYPKAHIHAMARRYAVKIFLSHVHHVIFESHYGNPPAKPYVIDIMGHSDYIAPPNWPCE